MVEVVGCNLLPWGFPGEVWTALCLVHDRASLNIVKNICIYAGPVHCFSGLGLHFLHSLVHAVEVSKGPVEELRGDAYLVSLQQDTVLNGEFIPGAPEVLSNPQDCLWQSGQPLRVRQLVKIISLPGLYWIV